MPSKKFALGACLLVLGTASATDRTYTVQKGDTVENIARRFKVTPAAIIKQNHLSETFLQPGVVLHIQDTSAAKAMPSFVTVNVDHGIIRRGPGSSAEKITMVDKGIKATVLGAENGWYKLKFPKGTVGWMRHDLVAAFAPVQHHAVKVAAAHPVPAAPVVTQAAAPVAAEKVAPAIAAPVAVAPVAKAAEAAPAKPAAPVHKATHRRTSRKQARKEQTTAVEVPNEEGVIGKLMQKAYGLRGTRYRYGGMSSRGLDCSGFTSTVFRGIGINLPRTSRSQSSIGYAVNRGELKAGDLVFFRTHRSSRINHVGIYAGNGKFIHAASGFGAVREDNLARGYVKEFAGARRVVKKHKVAGAAAERKAPSKGKPANEIPVSPAAPAPSVKKETEAKG